MTTRKLGLGLGATTLGATAARTGLAFVGGFVSVALCGAVIAGSGAIEACGGTPSPGVEAAESEGAKILALVAADVDAGKTYAQIVQDVGALLAGQAGSLVATLVTDALQYLYDEAGLSGAADAGAAGSRVGASARTAKLSALLAEAKTHNR